jgi:epoxyqueuosine reductase
MSDAKTKIAERASQLGFDLVGFTTAEPFVETRAIFSERVEAGYLGQWRYGEQRIRRECTPQESLPGARSIVCTATAYMPSETPYDPNAPGLRGAVSCHSWGHDYHRVIGDRLRRLAAYIGEEFPGSASLPCVDTGPIVDRAAAVRAGIGWFGKNGNVLTARFGSWVLLGELITTLDIEPDAPLEKHCGSCEICIDRCPTGAIGPDGRVDARRCISDLTQRKDPIPLEFRKSIGNRVWGCDDCQTPCPVNERKARTERRGRDGQFAPLPHLGTSVDLPSVLHMTKSQFRDWFGPTSMAWRGKGVLQRNAAVALGNSRDPAAVPHLIRALRDRKPLVRGHAAWALGELAGEDARSALESLLERESDAWVRDEAASALHNAGLSTSTVTGPSVPAQRRELLTARSAVE